MATPMNFQTLNFGNIPQQEAEARRRYYDSLGSIGGVVADTGSKVDDYLQRKQREAEDKKKWDNMIAQQEYQKKYQTDRDAIADKRYNDEIGRTLEKEKLENESLANAKKSLDGMPSPEHIGVMYGPGARSALVAMQNAPTYADFMNAQKDLNQSVYQKQMLREQRKQVAENEKRDSWMREADELVASVDDRAARNGIDLSRNAELPKDRAGLEALRTELEGLRDYLNTAPRHSINSAARVGAINAQIAKINRRLGPKPKRKWEKP